eukprot:g661.t1
MSGHHCAAAAAESILQEQGVAEAGDEPGEIAVAAVLDDAFIVSERQRMSFFVGMAVSVWWRDGQKWGGTIHEIIHDEKAVVVQFDAPYGDLNFAEVYHVDSGVIAPKGDLYCAIRVGRVERRKFEEKRAVLTKRWHRKRLGLSEVEEEEEEQKQSVATSQPTTNLEKKKTKKKEIKTRKKKTTTKQKREKKRKTVKQKRARQKKKPRKKSKVTTKKRPKKKPKKRTKSVPIVVSEDELSDATSSSSEEEEESADEEMDSSSEEEEESADEEMDAFDSADLAEVNDVNVEEVMDDAASVETTLSTYMASDEALKGMRYYNELRLWSSTVTADGCGLINLGYFRRSEDAYRVRWKLRGETRESKWTRDHVLTGRYTLFEAHHRLGRHRAGITIGSNGRVFMQGEMHYKCPGGRKKSGRYGEMLPPFVHVIIRHLVRRMGLKALSRATIYDLGSGLGNVAAQIVHEIDGCRVIGIENAYDLVECAKLYMSYVSDLHYTTDRRAFATNPLERLKYLYGDFFSYNLSDANVILVNNIAFPDAVNERLLRKIARETKEGCLVVLTHDIPYANKMSDACRNDGRSEAFARRHPYHPALSFHWSVVEPNPPPKVVGLGLMYAKDVALYRQNEVRSPSPDDDGFVQYKNEDVCELFMKTEEALEKRRWVSWGGGKTRAFYIYERVNA